ncbi:MAG: hypothetical protein IPI00_09335 [Flavobacteriales bacterium]|nr:hypothetical protein [Flavobacteriales bacterium]MBK6944167.1 hypothetical protein [Flavobacteriales bacterium]MBK7240368.1 hypothetical protein [Flavobacteriales bacterium]MBK7295339.1 hypothetical protein [Flavobacteriales bacterium]MBK9533834.1 hypothetical protein [Flavobacteriales bacterium]
MFNSACKPVILFLLASIFTFGCSQHEYKPEGINLAFAEGWKRDTLGCSGERLNFAKDSLFIIQKFEGVTVEYFTEVFGSPDREKRRELE